MNDQWRPKPPPRSRTGALGFVFVLLLFVAIAALIFLINPFAPGSVPGDSLATPAIRPASASPAGGTPVPGLPGQRWDLFLPLIGS